MTATAARAAADNVTRNAIPAAQITLFIGTLLVIATPGSDSTLPPRAMQRH